MTIAERLGKIDLSTKKEALKGTASLQTDHFAVLLVQGLESNDAHILNVSTFLLPPKKHGWIIRTLVQWAKLNRPRFSWELILLYSSHINYFVSPIAESIPDSQRRDNKEDGCTVTPPCCVTFVGKGKSCVLSMFKPFNFTYLTLDQWFPVSVFF